MIRSFTSMAFIVTAALVARADDACFVAIQGDDTLAHYSAVTGLSRQEQKRIDLIDDSKGRIILESHKPQYRTGRPTVFENLGRGFIFYFKNSKRFPPEGSNEFLDRFGFATEPTIHRLSLIHISEPTRPY